MKNLYELLDVTTDMSCEEIDAELGESFEYLTLEEQEAFVTLTNIESRNKYDQYLDKKEKSIRYDYVNKKFYDAPSDEDLEKIQKEYEQLFNGTKVKEETDTKKMPTLKLSVAASEFFRKHSGKIAVVGIAACIIIGGAHACKSCKEDSNIDLPTPTATPKPTATPVPTKAPVATVTPVPTSTPAPTPIVAEKVEKLDNSNIYEVAKQLTESYKQKGLEVNVEDVKSALIVANIENIDKDELNEIMSDSNIENEISKANNLAVAVTTHNINAICNNETSKLVTSSQLLYNESDKNIIDHLDNTTISFVNSKNLTKKQYDSSLEYVSNFYMELGLLDVNGEEYSYDDLTAGAKYVSEMCVWPNLAVAYTINQHSNEKSFAVIAATQTVANDGIRYMTELSNCAKTKQLTK